MSGSRSQPQPAIVYQHTGEELEFTAEGAEHAKGHKMKEKRKKKNKKKNKDFCELRVLRGEARSSRVD
jgi:hypothetical protein